MSLKTRAALVVALFVGFYALSLAVALGLFAVPAFQYFFMERVFLKLSAFSVVAGVVVLFSAVPRWDSFTPRGLPLTRGDHPALFDEIDRIAAATEQAPPVEVYLLPELNAWVAERGGVMGLGSRRVMGLGLPLVQLLTVSQLRSVLAHEFGHFHGGDTALGPWIYKTQAGLARTVQNLAEASHPFFMVVQSPFKAYAEFFFKVSHAVSRAQEYGADALAARTAGPEALIGGLTVLQRAGPFWPSFLEEELSPVLGAGRRPPLFQGFQQFLNSERVRGLGQKLLQHELDQGVSGDHDTHPCLRDRIAAVKGLELPDDIEVDSRPATDLLKDIPDLDVLLLDSLTSLDALSLEPVAWEDVADAVLLPGLRKAAGGATLLHGKAIASVDVGPKVFSEVARVASRGQTDDPGLGVWVVSAAVSVSLVEQGWTLECRLGQEAGVRKGEHFVVPWLLLEAARAGGVWADLLAEKGVGDEVFRVK
jgi:heat shock protein HtpX